MPGPSTRRHACVLNRSRDRPPPPVWLVWSAALACYVLGVFHRSSLGVAGLEASERFGVSATQLGSFVVLQLAVYAVLQVPVGLVVDRYGPRSVLLAGVTLMSVGQLLFANADTYLSAMVARTLVGAGDASTFVCVLRITVAWFAPPRVPLVTQIAGPMGQVGAIAAAAPMAWALRSWGWESSYAVAATLGIVLFVIVLVCVHDEPGLRTRRGEPQSWAALVVGLRESWSKPATRLGFWIHFSQHFSSTLLALVWGFPFFVVVHGISENAASALLTVLIVAVVLSGPVIGWLVGARPDLRLPVAVASIALVAGAWAVVLAWPGHAPFGVLIALVVVVGATGPVAMIGFDLVRTGNPPDRLASASGIVNQGGFLASVAIILLVGLVLDLGGESALGGFEPSVFRAAMSLQYFLWLAAMVQIWRFRGGSRSQSLLS